MKLESGVLVLLQGKYSTIFYLSLLYSVGNWVMALAAVPSPNQASMFTLYCTAIALALIAFGTGGIKPCVSAFGGDQIEWSMTDGEDKDRVRRKFFSLYYFAINAGAFISTILTPVLRKDMSYAVAFAVPAFLMILAVFIFWLGRKTYIDRPPEGNIFPIVSLVMTDAFQLRKDANAFDVEVSKGNSVVRRHWLDAAKLKHDEDVVEDIKMLFQVLIVLLPAPLFWSLSDQQSSKWVFQAREMDGRLPWLGGLVIQPDQMQVLVQQSTYKKK
jgi:dipeptide/tripeptide permease